MLPSVPFFFYVIFFFQFYWDIIDIQHCINLRSTEWFDLHTSWNGYHSRFSEHLYHIDAKWKKKIVFFLIRTVEIYCLQFSSVQSLSRVRLCNPTNSRSSLNLTSIESEMPCSRLIFCRHFFLLPPIPPSIRVFSSESTLRVRWPKYQSFSLSVIPSKEHPGLISFRMDCLDLPAVQGTLESLLQHHSSKASILQHSAFFTVQLSHP